MKDLYIDGKWLQGRGKEINSLDKASGEIIWQGNSAGEEDVDQALKAARNALPSWSGLKQKERIQFLHNYAEILEEKKGEMALLISKETGKPLWESRSEVQVMINKIAITMEAFTERNAEKSFELGDSMARLRFKPIGVMGVLGPFNMPGHLPNGHIVPALLAGNTVVLKPSELTPSVGAKMVSFWEEADLPPGVLNLIQGEKETGKALVEHPYLNGLLFTGSYQTGKILHQHFAGQPEKMLALEMGGNNPVIATEMKDIEKAARLILESAYISSGQRCTCARRLILIRGDWSDKLIQHISDLIPKIRVGNYMDDPEPYMGPLISEAAAEKVLSEQEELIQNGAQSLIHCEPKNTDKGRKNLLSPGLLDVSQCKTRKDEEIFGPLLQIIQVENFDQALKEASDTGFGLAAALFSDSADLYKKFLTKMRAGVINWNRKTTGASSKLPFGGVGHSGNFRPSAAFASDYSAYPVASLETEDSSSYQSNIQGLED